MRRACLAACAAAMSFAANPAVADCCLSGPDVIYAAPPVTIVVPPTGYLLDPTDAYRPVHIVDPGPMLPEPIVLPVAVPTYSEGGYAYPTDYPYVRSYYGDRWFAAPPPRRYGWRHRGSEGRRLLSRPRVVRAGYGYGNVSPPYGAYRYRPAHGARVIHVPQHLPPK